MQLPLFQVDAFTSCVFSGNPAGVVLLDEPLPDQIMQSIAAENNLSETAFVMRAGDASKDTFALRWFTPRIEVDLCGHATLASAHVLFAEQLVRGDTARFETASGLLAVQRQGDLLTMDFPARPPQPAACDQNLVAALGLRPREVQHSERDWLAVFTDEEAVAALAPRLDLLAALDAFAVIVSAPGRHVDFVSRFFAPRAGVPEDPVTGSAHCTLIPYWADRLGKKQLVARQISRRGGELFCEDQGDRVLIGGRAVSFLQGTINL
jgi:PhzF family phenazine biosynthesis protein